MLNRIKYLLMVCGLVCGLNLHAQSSACDGTTPVAVLGTNTVVGPLTGGGAQTTCIDATDATNAAWYTYTPAADATVTLESCNGGVDTRASVYTGASCAALTCLTGNDDACTMGPGLEAYATSVSFAATGGTTYYIMWDDRWSDAGFDWLLSESNIDCPALGLNIGDPCDAGLGTGVVYDDCTCGPILAPDCATLLVPADGAVEVAIDPANDGVGISWSFNGFQPNDGTNIYWGTDPAALNLLGATGPNSPGATITGVTPGVYYWMAVPFNAAGEAVGCDTYMLSTENIATLPPDCGSLLSPVDLATNVALNGDTLIFTWTNATTGEPATANDFYLGVDPAALNNLGSFAADGDSLTVFGVQQGLTYFWSVVPNNGAGDAVGCQVFSFTVEGTPDCPLLGLNGLNIGNGCDDGDPLTFFDSVQDNCTCAGVPTPANATCDGAVNLVERLNNGNQIISGGGASNNCFSADPLSTDALWYTYTPTCDGDITISSSIDLDQPDTRLSVYTGDCTTLTCVASNDDVAADNFTSSVTFPGTGGTTYLIEWDNRWSITEFDFEVYSGASCPTDFDSTGASADLTDGADFSVFLGNFGLSCLGTGDLCACPTDLNHDGITDGEDFSIFLGNFGLPCPAAP